MKWTIAAAAVSVLIACGGDDDIAVAPDAASVADGGAVDGAAPDGASAFPLPGFGAITGDCDVLDTELTDPAPSVFRSAIAFDVGYTDDDLAALTDGGQEIVADDNAGGSSLLSEVFSFEVLARCELATLIKTELEIDYDAAGAITDLSVEMDGEVIGVSVTRAVAFPFDQPYTVEQARDLMEGKLADILESSANVSAADAWTKQVLAVIAYADMHADSVEAALAQIDESIRADTIVWIVVSDGDDAFLY